MKIKQPLRGGIIQWKRNINGPMGINKWKLDKKTPWSRYFYIGKWNKYNGDWEFGILWSKYLVNFWTNGDKYIFKKKWKKNGQNLYIRKFKLSGKMEKWKFNQEKWIRVIELLKAIVIMEKWKNIWLKGFKYVGEWKMQNMHGFGIGTWPNGDRYEGDWVNGQRTGQGKYFYSGGGVYTGEWKNNNRHGEGTMIWNDGVKEVAI